MIFPGDPQRPFLDEGLAVGEEVGGTGGAATRASGLGEVGPVVAGFCVGGASSRAHSRSRAARPGCRVGADGGR